MKRQSKSKTFNTFIKKATEIFGSPKITRDQAVSENLLFYWTGNPCEKGHQTYRYVSNRVCRQCSLNDYSLKNYGDNHEEQELKSNIADLEYQLELKRLEKEYDYDI